MTCPLCDTLGGRLVYPGRALRVIHADEAGFPAFYRVVWQSHVAEFSDLTPDQCVLCMDAVTAVERALRATLADQAAAKFIDLDDDDTAMGVQGLEAMGLLAAGRAAEILGAPVQPQELP